MIRRVGMKALVVVAWLGVVATALGQGQVKLRVASEGGDDRAQSNVVEREPRVKPAKKERETESRDASTVDKLASIPISREGATATIEEAIPTKIFRNVRALKALARAPRSEFAPKKRRNFEASDAEIFLEDGARLETAYEVALLNEAADVRSTDRALIVELGAGYCATVVGLQASRTFAVGSDKTLLKRAVGAAKNVGVEIEARVGDPTQGWAENAPYDKIVATRALSEIPPTLVDQLQEGGKIVAPTGDRFRQLIVIGEKKDGKLVESVFLPCSFDPINQNDAEKHGVEGATPTLIGGGFEELDPTPIDLSSAPALSAAPAPNLAPRPVGWYDAFNFIVEDAADAPEGRRACAFDNIAIAEDQRKRDANAERVRAATLPEERRDETSAEAASKARRRRCELTSRMRQKFALDGGAVKKLVASGALRVDALETTDAPVVAARLSFFDKDGRFLEASAVASASAPTGSWQNFSVEISPPVKTKEAILEIGLLDSAVGRIVLDNLSVKNKFERASKLDRKPSE